MVMVNNDFVFQRIVNFIEKNKYNNFGLFKRPLPLTRMTTLENDLRISCSDAEEFFVEFLKEFPFDTSNLNLSDYFYSEGFWLLPSLNKQRTPLPITLGMLENAVIAGTWINNNSDS